MTITDDPAPPTHQSRDAHGAVCERRALGVRLFLVWSRACVQGVCGASRSERGGDAGLVSCAQQPLPSFLHSPKTRVARGGSLRWCRVQRARWASVQGLPGQPGVGAGRAGPQSPQRPGPVGRLLGGCLTGGSQRGEDGRDITPQSPANSAISGAAVNGAGPATVVVPACKPRSLMRLEIFL